MLTHPDRLEVDVTSRNLAIRSLRSTSERAMFEDWLTSKDVPKILSFTNDIFGGPNGDDDEEQIVKWQTGVP